MASRGLVIGGVVVAALGGLALAAKSASASPDGRPPPPPPPTGGGGKTPKQIAQAHPAYNEWLNAVTQCDKYLAQSINSDDPNVAAAAADWCGQAAYLAKVMSDDGVPPGQWR